MILFLGSFLSRGRGTQPVSERVAKYLRRSDYEVSLVSTHESRIIRLLDYVVKILFKKYSIAFVDVFSDRAFFLAEWAVFWIGLRKKRIVLTLRGGKLAEFNSKNAARVRRLFGKAERVQTPSLFLKDEFDKLGYNIFYLPNPIELKQFPYKSVIDRKRGSSMLWVRAFSDIYNPMIPVEVISMLVSEFPDIRLTMVGPDGGMLREVKAQVDQLQLNDRVSFVGGVRNDLLFEYYQTHDVYLNTTSYESFGVAMVEAASCGIPIVSHNVGEVPYLWRHEEEVLMVEKGDVRSMADQVRRIFMDADLAAGLSMRARTKAEQFTWENILPAWRKLIIKG